MYTMDEQDEDPSQTESPERKEAKAARAGLVGGIGLLLLCPPLAYMQTGLTYNIFKEISLDFCGLPACLLPVGLAIALIIWSARRNKRAGKTPVSSVLIVYTLTIILVTMAVILAYVKAAAAA
ncbi:MAG: hypothetical protein JXB85_00770 [Anaerolineales bacterium]|nr:hypothetical protein [Anaerolineales bacterium]